MLRTFKSHFVTLLVACFALSICGDSSLAKCCRSASCCYHSGAIDSCGSAGAACCDGLGPIVGSTIDSPMGGVLMGGGFGGVVSVAGQLTEPTPPGEADWESIYISVSVPEDAKVTVNNKPTVSEGTIRRFVIRALEPGKTYKFVVRAETVNVWGIAMEDTKTVSLTTGTREEMVLTPVRNRKKPDVSVQLLEVKTAEDVPAKPADIAKQSPTT